MVKNLNVLLVEDEKRLASAIKFLFKENKIDCETVFDGKEGYEKALNNEYDVIILDVMLPNLNGLEILSKLRRCGKNTPIIMLTARSTVNDKITGLNLGADDYLPKPFDFDELIARVKALSRRSGFVVMDEISHGDLSLNLSTGELSNKDIKVKLNFKEKEIMKLFFISPDSVITKESLLNKVWGSDSFATDNNVEAYVSFLRKKLKFLKSNLNIKNYQKVGYKLEEEND